MVKWKGGAIIKENKTIKISDEEIENLARVFLPAILNFYNSEEGKQVFSEYCKIKQNNQDDGRRGDKEMCLKDEIKM